MSIRLEIDKNNNFLSQNGFTKKEEAEIYEQQLFDIISNPREYLDSLPYMISYRVSWKKTSLFSCDRAATPVVVVCAHSSALFMVCGSPISISIISLFSTY